MCGIVGFVNFTETESIVRKALDRIAYRGVDHSKVLYHDKLAFGHNLHSVVDYVVQPLESEKGILVINCEIYNWEELAKKHKIKAQNDSELVLKLLDSKKISFAQKIISNLDGDYALAYYSKVEKKLLLARDLVGVKPLVYFLDEKGGRIAFASEKKALNVCGLEAIYLNPRQGIIFDLNNAKTSFFKREFSKKKLSKPLLDLKKLFITAVEKRIPQKNFALLLSGGLDSSMIAQVIKNSKQNFTSLFAGVFDEENGFNEPKDYVHSVEVAKQLGTDLLIKKVTLEEFENELPKIISLIESSDPVRVGVASTIYFATKQAHAQGIRVVMSGLGADELFAGYHRFKNSNEINKDCYSYLIKMYENDLYFEDIICMSNKLELRVPFLDSRIISGSLSLPSKYKISNTKGKIVNKKILREIALLLGLSKEVAYREKKAAQYGSNFDKALEVLAKKNGFNSKALYLNSISSKVLLNKQKNIPLAALLSTGKDSVYALNLMERQGYDITCLVCIKSENKDSFMYHTPTIEMAKLQAKALGKRLIIVRSIGEKEKEIEDLKKGLLVAKKLFNIEGVVSGALFSNYQRGRIEKVCEDLSLRPFAPLWHLDQKQYLEKVVREGFVVMVTKIAAFGFSEKWLGRIIDSKAINELSKLNEEYGINVAGEGGEYESLVLDAPSFKKKLDIDFTKKLQNDFTGEIVINKALLKKKIIEV